MRESAEQSENTRSPTKEMLAGIATDSTAVPANAPAPREATPSSKVTDDRFAQPANALSPTLVIGARICTLVRRSMPAKPPGAMADTR